MGMRPCVLASGSHQVLASISVIKKGTSLHPSHEPVLTSTRVPSSSLFHQKVGRAKKIPHGETVRDLFWGGKWDSNPRQPESQSGTLPTELFPPEFEFCGLPGRDRTCDHLLRRQVLYPTELRADRLVSMHVWKLVGVKRFELPTSCSQSRRATRLRYTPGRSRILHEK